MRTVPFLLHLSRGIVHPKLGLLVITFSLAGCATYQRQCQSLYSHWQRGDLTQAAQEASAKATHNGLTNDRLLWMLGQATVLRTAGRYDESTAAFAQAEKWIDKYSLQAKVKLSHEVVGMLANPAVLPYEGRFYDRIMLNTYKALNYIAQGQMNEARPEIIRAYHRQQDAVEEHQQQIERMREDLARHKDKDRINACQQDPAFQEQLRIHYANLDELQVYADYVNPFTVLVDGLYFLYQGVTGPDLDRARKDFERILGFCGSNKFIMADLQTVEAAVRGQPLAPTTYVIFETGCAPTRTQVDIRLPVPDSNVREVMAAFPKLEFHNHFVPFLRVRAGDVEEQTVLVSSMDSVIGSAFKNELPMIITKTIASTVAKTMGTAAANEAVDRTGGPLGGVLGNVLDVYRRGSAQADTRAWITLPKQFQYCRLPTPADRRLEIATPDGAQQTVVNLEEALVNVVYVRSITPSSPLFISQLKLK